MDQVERTITGLRTIVVGDETGEIVVVLLHGYAMLPEDLAAFTHSIGLAAQFFLPEGPLEASPRGRAWWPIDQERRAAQMAKGARDLFQEDPEGLPGARALMQKFLAEVAPRPKGKKKPSRPLLLVGFSQGGMLLADSVLHRGPISEGLVLMSSSRISLAKWDALDTDLEGYPVMISHGRSDTDLAFAAGEELRNMFAIRGADTRWVPFDGGHEIPLPVWRQLRKLGREIVDVHRGVERSPD